MSNFDSLRIGSPLPPASTPYPSVNSSSGAGGDIEWFSASGSSKPAITPTQEFTPDTPSGDISQKTLLHICTSD
jgi:hypothetical protein